MGKEDWGGKRDEEEPQKGREDWCSCQARHVSPKPESPTPLGSFLTCTGSQKAWVLHPRLWSPEVWGVAYFPHNTRSCPEMWMAGFPGVPYQEGVMFRGDVPQSRTRRTELLSVPDYGCHVAYAPKHICAYPRWPFQRLNVGRGGHPFLSQVLTGRSRTQALDSYLPEMRGSWTEENYFLLYPRQCPRSSQSASQTLQPVSSHFTTPV